MPEPTESEIELVRSLYPDGVDLVKILVDPSGWEVTRPTLEPHLHPEVEVIGQAGLVPLAGQQSEGTLRPSSRGLDGFRNAFCDWLTAWETWVITKPEFIPAEGGRVLILFSVSARSKTHQVEMPVEAANLLTLREGQVIRMEFFLDQRPAREAAGLPGD